jgi:hypothetical protein
MTMADHPGKALVVTADGTHIPVMAVLMSPTDRDWGGVLVPGVPSQGFGVVEGRLRLPGGAEGSFIANNHEVQVAAKSHAARLIIVSQGEHGIRLVRLRADRAELCLRQPYGWRWSNRDWDQVRTRPRLMRPVHQRDRDEPDGHEHEVRQPSEPLYVLGAPMPSTSDVNSNTGQAVADAAFVSANAAPSSYSAVRSRAES